jgi:hypothetical protein
MSLIGIIKRSRERIKSIGFRRFYHIVKNNYLSPTFKNGLFSKRNQYFKIGDEFRISIPAFSQNEIRLIVDDLKKIYSLGRSDVSLYVNIVTTVKDYNDYVDISAFNFPIYVDLVETDRLVLSQVLWLGNIYVPEFSDKERAGELRRTLIRLGVSSYSSCEDIVSAFKAREIVTLKGSGRETQFLHRNLRDNLDGPHYGFREEIDLSIVQELPKKFEFFNSQCEVNFYPIRELNKYPGRVSRQYVVGEMYKKPYFDQESVLDVGCDIRGISEYVGTNTKYVGVDMQGLADFQINLDLEGFPFEKRQFSTVLCYEVLEHLNKIHERFDDMLSIADKYFVGSLFVESGVWSGRSISRFGNPLGNMYLPIAPIYDRHEWIFSVTDALDFVYYRAKLQGFTVRRLDIFYDDAKLQLFQLPRLRRAFRAGNISYLSKEVMMIAFVLERRVDSE